MKKLRIFLVITIILGQFICWPLLALAATDNYATVNLITENAHGQKVDNVYFDIYQQLSDVNGNYAFGNRLTHGKITTLGRQDASINMSSSSSLTIVIVYYREDKAYEKYVIWDQTITTSFTRAIYLDFSSIHLIIKGANGQLLKDIPYDIYSVITDVSGYDIPATRLYKSQKTGLTGDRVYYFVPGKYIIRFYFPEIKNIYPLDYIYTINNARETDITYTLSNIKVAVKDYNNTWKKNAEFKLYKKQQILDQYAYQEIGKFNTSFAYKILFLPNGDYKIEFKGPDKKYSKVMEFSLAYGQEKELVYNFANNSNAITSSNPNSNLSSDSLYDHDSDGDMLTDFEEFYLWRTDPFKMDSDSDGYNDNIEITYGYNPNGYGRYNYVKYSYNKPRMKSPSMEKELAQNLKIELEARLGRSFYVSSADWNTLVKAYLYGGYSIDEIKNTIVYGPGLVHPTIPANQWRKK